MTRERIYGSDTEFCDWMRKCKDLPSFGNDFGFVASDNDITVHRYLTAVDNIGTREIQSIMQIEIKTREGKPSESQIDTLAKLNLFNGIKKTNGQHVVFFGVFLLILSGTSPDNSDCMWWGVLPKNSIIKCASYATFHLIDKRQLIDLLRFDRHPRNLDPNAFRRHHKTREIVVIEKSKLGYEFERRIINRS